MGTKESVAGGGGGATFRVGPAAAALALFALAWLLLTWSIYLWTALAAGVYRLLCDGRELFGPAATPVGVMVSPAVVLFGFVLFLVAGLLTGYGAWRLGAAAFRLCRRRSPFGTPSRAKGAVGFGAGVAAVALAVVAAALLLDAEWRRNARPELGPQTQARLRAGWETRRRYEVCDGCRQFAEQKAAAPQERADLARACARIQGFEECPAARPAPAGRAF